MKRIVTALLCCLCASLASAQSSPQAAAETRYIRDSLGVSLRNGNSDSAAVIMDNLRSGTVVTLLQLDERSGFARVRAPNGREGWIASRYLQKEPTYELKYKEALARIAQLEQGGASLQPRIAEPKTDEALRHENARLAHELEELKTLSAKAIDIDRNNKALIRKNELLQTEVDKLSAENDRLGSQAAKEEWTRTLIAIGFGILLTLTLPRLVPRKKRYSDW